jgi:hypothetical protein
MANIQQLFPFKYLPVHQLLIVLPFDAIKATSAKKQWTHCPPAEL